MNIKSDLEKDPSRCRLLRQNERQFVSDLKETDAALSSARDELKEKRNKMREMKDEERRLKVLIAGATIASGGRRAVGHVMNGLAQVQSTELAVLQSRVGALGAEIKLLEGRIIVLEPRRRTLANDLEQNAHEMTSLNCVR